MNAAEYANLDAVEKTHWYYAGKRELVRWWIERVAPPEKESVLLDCGAGTGRFALEMQERCRVLVLDDHEEALALLRKRFRAEQVIALAGDAVPLPEGSLDYVTALDVLEHVPDDAAVARGFHRLLKPGGVAVVTVPASMALWSDWDEALHHFRRYNRTQLRALFPEEQWDLVFVNYTNVVAYPAVWLVRKWRKIVRPKPAEAASGARAEDREPAAWLNALLRKIFVTLGKWRVPFPFGVSLILVARKR
jgi:Methylase involved in ubiquinone/menaquinone biosynthesis